MSEQPVFPEQADPDNDGWYKVAEEMSTWHPGLQEHARRNLAKRQLGHLVRSAEIDGYRDGWGFFDTTTVDPAEFQITDNDDLRIEQILGEKEEVRAKVGPLDAEKLAIAQEGMCRLFAAAWGFDNDKIVNITQAREKLFELNTPARAKTKQALHAKGKYLCYQRPRPGVKYHEAFASDWFGDYLHFGVNALPNNTEETDTLDTLMRVYIHAKPEYAGHIAAEVIRRMRTRYQKEIYGKVLDISTADSPNTVQKQDNLLLYLRTHSELRAAAVILKELVSERPQVFDVCEGIQDRARKTDIPFVSIAEEPVQRDETVQESFNSSRELVEAAAERLIEQKFCEAYPEIGDLPFNQVFKYAYFNGFKTKQELREMYRQAVRYCAPKYGVSQTNYAMNSRQD